MFLLITRPLQSHSTLVDQIFLFCFILFLFPSKQLSITAMNIHAKMADSVFLKEMISNANVLMATEVYFVKVRVIKFYVIIGLLY